MVPKLQRNQHREDHYCLRKSGQPDIPGIVRPVQPDVPATVRSVQTDVPATVRSVQPDFQGTTRPDTVASRPVQADTNGSRVPAVQTRVDGPQVSTETPVIGLRLPQPVNGSVDLPDGRFACKWLMLKATSQLRCQIRTHPAAGSRAPATNLSGMLQEEQRQISPSDIHLSRMEQSQLLAPCSVARLSLTFSNHTKLIWSCCQLN